VISVFSKAPCEKCLKLPICRNRTEIECDDILEYLGNTPRLKACNLIGILRCNTLYWSNPKFPTKLPTLKVIREDSYVRDLERDQIKESLYLHRRAKVRLKFLYFKCLTKLFNFIRFIRGF